MRSLRNTWQCAVSHIFNVRGTNVNFICATTDNTSLDTVIAARRIKFLQSNLYARIGKRELIWLRTLTDDWSVIFAWYSSTVYVVQLVCSSLSFSFIFIYFSLYIFCLLPYGE